MKRSYLYITLLLVVLTLGSCKIGKSYVRPELNLPDSLAQHQDSLSSEIRNGGRFTLTVPFGV